MLTFDELFNTANDYLTAKQHSRALPFLNEALEHYPTRALQVYDSLTDCYMGLEDYGKSYDYADLILESIPDHLKALRNSGVCLIRKNLFSSALSALKTAESIAPNDLMTLTNLAFYWQQVGEFAKAIEYFHKAIAVDPSKLELRMWLGMAQLTIAKTKEEFDTGYANYEARLGFANPCPINRKPLWRGEDLTGKRLVIFTEQGIGDNIMTWRFCCDRWIQKHFNAEKVYLGCDPKLAGYFMEQGQDIEILIGGQDALPEYDYQFPMMSFPWLLNSRPDIPAPANRYLKAESFTAWLELEGRALKQEDGKLRIGICWKGNPTHRNDQWRSLSKVDLEFLIGRLREESKDSEYYLMSNEPKDETLVHLGLRYLECLDITSLAAAIAQMDIIVTVDTATAHIAGGLGKRVAMLVTRNPDWRWGEQSSVTNLYPLVNIIRQKKDRHSWDDCIRRTANHIAGYEYSDIH
jgi:tetratricopeptide (TPR) repeat protein